MDKSKLFDQKIRDAINKYEVPFDDSAWKNIEKEINVQPNAKVINYKTWIISAAAAAALVVAYFAFQPANETMQPKMVEEVKKPESKNTTMSLPIVEESKKEEETSVEAEEGIVEETLEVKSEKGKESTPFKTKEENNGAANDSQFDVVEQDQNKPDEESIAKNTPVEQVDHILMNIHLDDERICENEALRFSISDCNVPVEIRWDFGDGYVAEGPTVSHQYANEGNYIVKMYAKSVLNEELVENDSFSIVVDPKPKAEFEIEKSENMAAYPEVTFKAISDQVSSIEWNFADGNNDQQMIVEKLYKSKGNYSVGLIVKNEFQCTDTVYKSVVIQNDFNLLAPNAFSPNGDGINDTFMPQALPYINQSFTLQVFEPKTGRMIFESTAIDKPWNGSFMNSGTRMNEGAYAWSVITEDGSVYKGTILITNK